MKDTLDLVFSADVRDSLDFANAYLDTLVQQTQSNVVAAWPAASAAFRSEHGRTPESLQDVRAALLAMPAYRSLWRQYNQAVDVRWGHLAAAERENHDRIERELASVPERGLGELRLNPSLRLPAYYTDHVIHLAPGSFYGNHIYAMLTDMANGPWTLRKATAWAAAEREVARAIPDGAYHRIADFGCGLGRHVLPLKARFPLAHVIGVDLAAPELRYGHWIAEQRHSAIDFLQEDLRATSLGSGSVDLVLMAATQHELPQPVMREALAEARRVLRPGGLFANVDVIPNRHMPAFTRYWYGRHVESGSEPFWLEAGELHLPDELAAAGFADVREIPPDVPIGPTGPNGPWWTLARAS